jgi:hypothetical protein
LDKPGRRLIFLPALIRKFVDRPILCGGDAGDPGVAKSGYNHLQYRLCRLGKHGLTRAIRRRPLLEDDKARSVDLFMRPVIGYQAVEKVTTVYDFHATILHLLGLDHRRLSFYHNGIERRLTDVHGEVVQDILAV